MANKEIHDLDPVGTATSDDLLASQQDAGGGIWVTGKLSLSALGVFINKVLQYASDLHTTNKTIIGAINELQSGGGGASDLDDLTDVAITSPTEGQILKYDSANQLWKNADASYSVNPAIINIAKTMDATTFTITITSGGVTAYQDTITMDSIWGNFTVISDTFTVDGIINTISLYGNGVEADTSQNWLHVTLNGTQYDIGNTVRNPSYPLNTNVNASVRGAGLTLPSAPSTDGTYKLQLVVSSGVPTLTWVSVS